MWDATKAALDIEVNLKIAYKNKFSMWVMVQNRTHPPKMSSTLLGGRYEMSFRCGLSCYNTESPTGDHSEYLLR